jgi:lactobin A/cerein 7B family class IIb bacteriocin
MKPNIINANFHGISDISMEELKKVNGGIANIYWFLLGFAFGGIEDFNAGYAAGKK